MGAGPFFEPEGTPHRFMVDAVVESVERARARQSFIDDSEAAYQRVISGEPVFALEDVLDDASGR